MWFTESSGGHVGRITTSGAITEYSSGGMPGARGIAAGPDGNLWFTYGAGWGRMTPSGTLLPTPPRSYPSPGPSISIVKGPDNAMYITYIIDILGGSPGAIERVTPDGQGQLFTVPSRPAGGNAGPYGITSGPDGALWITEATAGRIARMTPAGAFTEYPLPSGSASGPGFITVGPDGALWFAEEIGRIGRITASGAVTEFSAPDPASRPFGIAAGPDGAIWFTEQSGNRIGRLPLSGAQGGSALQFVPVAPCRVLDTRNTNGPLGGPAIQGGTSRSFQVSSSNCGIPSTAAAFSMNVTVVPQGSLGYVTLWPAGQSQPLVSTLNSLDGRIKANAAMVPAGPSGTVSAFATDTTDLVLDINGYFATTPGLQFFPLPPCRIADTRNATGSLGGPSIPAGRRTFPILSSNCGIPAGAQAYSLNMTVVPDGQLAYLTVWPTGQAQPFVSTLNDITGTTLRTRQSFRRVPTVPLTCSPPIPPIS